MGRVDEFVAAVLSRPEAMNEVLKQLLERVAQLQADVHQTGARVETVEARATDSEEKTFEDVSDVRATMMALSQQLCSFEDEVMSDLGELRALLVLVRKKLDAQPSPEKG